MKSSHVRYTVLLPLVLAATVFLWCAPTGFFGNLGEVLTATQQRTIAIFTFAALMWIFEIVPNWATSLMVIVISLLTISTQSLPFIADTGDASVFMSSKELMRSFSDPMIMLFLGGFVMAIVASKYGIDVKLARIMFRPFGTAPKTVLLGFLVIIAVFSMFMSNTATATMFLTFLTPVLATMPDSERGKAGLALAIPLAANIGGIGTLVGTPPNATAAGILESNGISVSFTEWAFRMIPLVAVMIVLAWGVLIAFFPFTTKRIVIEIPEEKRKTTWRDRVVWVTFLLTLLLWITEQIHGISCNVVALIPLAVYSATGIFTTEDMKEINWDILWLVAGGFALGYALNDTGLAEAMVRSIDFDSMSVAVTLVVAGLFCYFMSNFISNSATAALLIPIMVALGRGLLESPNATAFTAMGGQKALAAYVAVCASFAMCLPISTPPNALAASTGLIKTRDMAVVGLIIGAAGLVLAYFWITVLFPFSQN